MTIIISTLECEADEPEWKIVVYIQMKCLLHPSGDPKASRIVNVFSCIVDLSMQGLTFCLYCIGNQKKEKKTNCNGTHVLALPIYLVCISLWFLEYIGKEKYTGEFDTAIFDYGILPLTNSVSPILNF